MQTLRDMYTTKEADQVEGWFHEPKKLKWIFNGFSIFMGLLFITMTIYVFFTAGQGQFLFVTAVFIFLMVYMLLLACKLDKVIG